MTPRARWADPRAWFRRPDALLWIAVVVGLLGGIVVVVLRNFSSEQLSPDALKIWRISSGQRPDFVDQSFTPVATIYRMLGMGDAPLLAGLFSFALAAAVVTFTIFRLRPHRIGWPVALYVLAAYLGSAYYLGQYSKDIFVLPVAFILLMSRRIWWEIPIIGAMIAYSYWFRDYWFLITVGYVAYRAVTWVQVRVRYLLIIGSLAAVAIGLGNFLVLGNDPNYFREKVVSVLEANTQLLTIVPLPQPVGGLIDLFVNYWLILVPLALPFTAGLVYVAVSAVLIFLRLLPLSVARSARRWPSVRTLDGVIARRALSLLCAFAAVQAVFEPDYGSVLRHLMPLLPVGLALLLSLRHALPRTGQAEPWSWTGRARA
ncbi:hypothetical protein [Microbacterium rhizophilus]|uniref:hypothetical protein n=1 Tax=Microbacterium rhizophilus TaxID=3138934 RepID=UPI0031EE9F9E